jgi:hypothetical protein
MKTLFMSDLNCLQFEAQVQEHAYLQEQQPKMIFDFTTTAVTYHISS